MLFYVRFRGATSIFHCTDCRFHALLFGALVLSACTSTAGMDKQEIQSDAGELVAGAVNVAERPPAVGHLVSLAKVGQGLKFAGLPASSKLAIRYGSVSVGTISVTVNDQPPQKVNVHSTGNLTSSFLMAKIDIPIPAGALLTIGLTETDVPVTVESIIIGDGDLGLRPDIWNLPSLPVAAGPYAADWKEMSRLYTAPEWWRDAKFGAWSHWDPQSMPEQGDWYARGMYQENSAIQVSDPAFWPAVRIRLQGHLPQLGH